MKPDQAASALVKARTYWRLGPTNLLRVATYRALLRTGVYRRLLPIAKPLVGPFFDWSGSGGATRQSPSTDAVAWGRLAERVMGGELPVFSHRWVDAGFPPRWQCSVISQIEANRPDTHWTQLPDFGLRGGDVKGYWEPSRFDGLLILVIGWLCTRRGDIGSAIEQWLSSWCEGNPANAGLQWKCGQETGIRLMQGLLAAELLQRWSGVVPSTAFCHLAAQHCARIAPTMLYAVGQDNNHGTSEAVALFTAGMFLVRHAPPDIARRGEQWRDAGRYWLQNRIARLVLADGSFAQHSVNYHRMALDTCSFAETFRRWYGEPPLLPTTLESCRAATRWLAAFTDPTTGDAPNLGANDGARLFVLHRQPYRDCRPSVQWASVLFCGQREYPKGAHDEPLHWLGLEDPPAAAPAPLPVSSRLWPEGGYATLVAPGAWAMLRLPRYRFRPSHADALHLDLWVGGRNLLRDGGSYAYNAEPRWLRYFGGTESHNTVQFDGRDQMPHISRFLFGDWLECEELDVDVAATAVSASYRDSMGASHRRSVVLGPGHMRVTDDVAGFHERAVLRWRLAPGTTRGTIDGAVWTDGTLRIETRSSAPIARFECVEGWESHHYADKTPLPVLEVEVHSDATLTTEVTWPS